MIRTTIRPFVLLLLLILTVCLVIPLAHAQANPDNEAWKIARQRGTVAAFQEYLDAFPNGRNTHFARSALASLQVQAQAKRRTEPDASNKLEFKDCPQVYCPVMVVIPKGSFSMGSNDGPANEKPQRSVNVSSFALGKYEVMHKQWMAVMDISPSRFNYCSDDDCAVTMVSWNDIQEFLRRLNQITGKQYRLASEAEWEYAARSGSTGRWSFGDDESALGQHAWWRGNSGMQNQWVGQKQANAFGLHDMHGNAWEWVQDCFVDNYSAGQPTDGSAYKGNDSCSFRAARGGGFSNYPDSLRSATRVKQSSDFQSSQLGFRIANTIP